MNSLLGTIELGTWQLGQATAVVTEGSFTASANPKASVTYEGGVVRPFTSVLGTILLGIFQVGQVPYGSVTEQETAGKGSFQGRAFPTVNIPPFQLTGGFTASANPTAQVIGNKGPLLVIFSAFPTAAASFIFYYADGAFVCAPDPTVYAQGVQSGGVLFSAFPEVSLAPIIGQQVSCLTGPNPPNAEVSNYVY